MRLEKPSSAAVALGHGEGGEGDISGVDFGGREFLWLGQPRMQPEPVPMSRCEAVASEVGVAGRAESRTARRSSATSMRCSVSGRGMRTSALLRIFRGPRILLAGEGVAWVLLRRRGGGGVRNKIRSSGESKISFGVGVEPSAVTAGE